MSPEIEHINMLPHYFAQNNITDNHYAQATKWPNIL